MKKYAVLAFLMFFLGGCVSQQLQGYVGKDIRDVMLDIGPPVNAFDMGDGRRAFQWVINSSYTVPTNIMATNYAIAGQGPSAWVSSNTMINGGQSVSSQCLYTLFGRWQEEQKSWKITEFKKPSFECEL